MPYAWNPLWVDPDSSDNPAYVASIRRMIIASINWIAEHPDADPQWQEPNKRLLARNAGIPDDVPIEQIAFTGGWKRFFRPTEPEATAWFDAIETACEAFGGKENASTGWMFAKAVACGLLFRREGWEGFNRFMLERHEKSGH